MKPNEYKVYEVGLVLGYLVIDCKPIASFNSYKKAFDYVEKLHDDEWELNDNGFNIGIDYVIMQGEI